MPRGSVWESLHRCIRPLQRKQLTIAPRSVGLGLPRNSTESDVPSPARRLVHKHSLWVPGCPPSEKLAIALPPKMKDASVPSVIKSKCIPKQKGILSFCQPGCLAQSPPAESLLSTCQNYCSFFDAQFFKRPLSIVLWVTLKSK